MRPPNSVINFSSTNGKEKDLKEKVLGLQLKVQIVEGRKNKPSFSFWSRLSVLCTLTFFYILKINLDFMGSCFPSTHTHTHTHTEDIKYRNMARCLIFYIHLFSSHIHIRSIRYMYMDVTYIYVLCGVVCGLGKADSPSSSIWLAEELNALISFFSTVSS